MKSAQGQIAQHGLQRNKMYSVGRTSKHLSMTVYTAASQEGEWLRPAQTAQIAQMQDNSEEERKKKKKRKETAEKMQLPMTAPCTPNHTTCMPSYQSNNRGQKMESDGYKVPRKI